MNQAPAVQYAHSPEGVSLAYTVHGEGPPLLVLPITPGNIELQWQVPEIASFLLALAEHLRVIRFDPRGWGLSSGDRDREAHERDIEAVLDAVGESDISILSPVGPIAGSAIRFTLDHPERVRSFVLWNPGYQAARPITALWDSLGEFPALVEDTILLWRGYREQARDIMAPEFEQERRAKLGNFPEDLRNRAAEVRCPVLIGYSTESPFEYTSPARDLAAIIPGARLNGFRRSEPDIFAGDQSEVLPLVLEFLTGRPPGLDSPGSFRTILFTDLAGSTAMQSRLGDEGAREMLRAHDAAVRQAISEFNGREVKHTGDGMMTAFGSAADAVNCALTVRGDIETYSDTHDGEELLVRFGLNAGEPIAEDDDLFGLSVTLAARIGDWGEPGQVLVSDVVRPLLLGKGFNFASVGSAELKGFDEPVPLYEVSDL